MLTDFNYIYLHVQTLVDFVRLIIFGSIFIKKRIKLNFILKNETGSNWPVSVWVRFGFFDFELIKLNWSVFLRFGFFSYFFSGFLGLINFLVFLLTPKPCNLIFK